MNDASVWWDWSPPPSPPAPPPPWPQPNPKWYMPGSQYWSWDDPRWPTIGRVVPDRYPLLQGALWETLLKQSGFVGKMYVGVTVSVPNIYAPGGYDTYSSGEQFSPEAAAEIDKLRNAGYDFKHKHPDRRTFNTYLGFFGPQGLIQDIKIEGNDGSRQLLQALTFVAPIFAPQIAAALNVPTQAVSAAIKIASGAEPEKVLVSTLAPIAAQEVVSFIGAQSLNIDPTLLEVSAPEAAQQIAAEMLQPPALLPEAPYIEAPPAYVPPVSVFEPVIEVPYIEAPPAYVPPVSVFEPVIEVPYIEAPLLTALPEVLPTFEPMPDIGSGSVWEATVDAPVFFDEAPMPNAPMSTPTPIQSSGRRRFRFIPEPAPEPAFETGPVNPLLPEPPPTIEAPTIEVPTMLDDPFTLPEGYDIGFDPYTFDIPEFDIPAFEVPTLDAGEPVYMEPVSLETVTVDQVAPLTPDALASVEVADFASVPVTTVPPPAADEWTLREVITDATAAMVAAAGLVVAFNRLRDVAGGGAVNSTASARTGTGAQVQARDDGMVWTRDPQGRVTSSKPAAGLLQMTTTGNGIINNGNGTYTLIRPDGSRSTLRYPGTAGAALSSLPAWAPWALAGGAALLLVAARRR